MISWNFRDLWNLTGWLREDLEQAEASAQAKWTREHTPEGTHTDITADSVTADTLNGQLRAPAGSASDPGMMFGDTGAGFFGGTNAVSLALDRVEVVQVLEQGAGGSSAREIQIVAGAFGTGAVPGPRVTVGYNSSGSGAAACLSLQQRNGSAYYLWVDGGKLCIGLNPPTEDDSVPHAGTVVGTQT